MLEIWGRKDSVNVQKATWAAAELGLDCERIDVGGAYGGLDTPEFGAMNPNRSIPTLRDGDFTLWESNAIVRYLAATHDPGGLWPTEPRERAVAEQWMDWQQTTLLADMRVVYWGLVRTTDPEKRNHAQIDAAVERLKTLWQRLDQHLRGRSFVAGDRLTVGDIPVGAACHRYHALGVERPEAENLSAWYERLTERPAFQRQVMLTPS